MNIKSEQDDAAKKMYAWRVHEARDQKRDVMDSREMLGLRFLSRNTLVSKWLWKDVPNSCKKDKKGLFRLQSQVERNKYQIDGRGKTYRNDWTLDVEAKN